MPLKHLPNAPLVEAVFEMTFSGEPIVLTRLHEYFDFIRDSYPALWVPNAQPGIAPALQPWEFKRPDGKRWVAISVNSFAYHVSDYVDYADFRKDVVPLAKRFCDLYRIERVNRFAARYVNNIALLRLPSEPIRLGNYLNLGIQLPPAIDGEALEDIHLHFTAKIKDSQIVVNLHHALGEQGRPESLLLVLDCAVVSDVPTADLEAHLDKVHAAIEDSFAALAAEPYMQFLKGETA